MLFIVSTPIGNLSDITHRAIETLKSVDLIAAEDTRHTKILLDHYGITTPTTSYFEQNEMKKAQYLVGLLKEGKKIALVSDAGTPGISDPGYRIITLAKKEGIPVTVVPGACALIASLCVSGLPTDKFVFEGFLPVKSAARRLRLEGLKSETRTIIFYESPYRVQKTLSDIAAVLNDPEVVVAREITKKFEEVKKGRASEFAAFYSKTRPKGEFVFLLSARCHELKVN
jgi:16S rRNA (cytidine1402-2'-O)-methyltransferase